jgi:hypothetical protein
MRPVIQLRRGSRGWGTAVNSGQHPPGGQVARRSAGPLRLRLRWLLWRLYGLFGRIFKYRRRYMARRVAGETQTWRDNLLLVWFARVTVYVFLVLLVLWVARAVRVVIIGDPRSVWPDLDTYCSKMSFSCDVLNNLFWLVLSLIPASAIVFSLASPALSPAVPTQGTGKSSGRRVGCGQPPRRGCRPG